jgi:hypothetical protein
MKAVFRDSVLLNGTINGARYLRENPSEPYVTIPPAYMITDEIGAMWSFGTEYELGRDGQFEFNVIRNDVDTGETASRIEYRGGKVRIFGRDGWRIWSGRTFI